MRTSNASRHDIALDAALEGALEQLGIERVRFQALGPEQQRLALAEAIYTSVKDLNVGANWILNAAHFSGKALADFSIEEINQHYRLVHALVALVCLGESAYIRPLVTYLSFPEPRWSLIIEPILKALSGERVPSAQHGLRSPRALRLWRAWAAQVSPSPTFRTAARRPQTTEPGLRWDVSFQQDLFDSLWLISGHQWTESRSEFFDPQQAKDCAHVFYSVLRAKRLDSFLSLLDQHLRDDDALAFVGCETVAACLRDKINELGVRSQLIQAWTPLLRDVAPRTNILLFHVLKPTASEKRFATRLVKDLLVDASDFEHAVVSGLIRQKPGLDTAYLLVKAAADPNALSARVRAILIDAAPLASRVVWMSLRRALTDDTENLCLLANEDNYGRWSLSRIVGARRNALDRELKLIGEFVTASEPWPRSVATVVGDLLRRRTVAAPSGDEWRVQTRAYLGTWIAVLNEWLGRRSRHVASERESKGTKMTLVERTPKATEATEP